MPMTKRSGIGVLELVGAVRRHGAAAVDVRVDQRRQRARALDGRIEIEPHLGQDRPVRPETRGRDDSRRPVSSAIVPPLDARYRLPFLETRSSPKPVVQLDAARRRAACSNRVPELARALRADLRRAPPSVWPSVVPPDRPTWISRIRRRFRRGAARSSSTLQRRVSAADDQNAPVRRSVALGAEHIGYPIKDTVDECTLAERGHARGAEVSGCVDCAGGIDHGGGAAHRASPSRPSARTTNGCILAPAVLHAVAPIASDTGTPRASSRMCGASSVVRSQRLQVALDDVVARSGMRRRQASSSRCARASEADAASTLNFQGENIRTCPQRRTPAPTRSARPPAPAA